MMTEREKIIELLRDNRNYELRYYPDDNNTEVVIDYETIADALIAAGIGDVSTWKHRAEVAERQAILLSKWLAEKTRKDYPWQAWLDAAQKQAEKELAEEKKDD